MSEPHATNGSGFREFLPEFVYGGIDGAITTFAVVAGATGAGFEIPVIIILGFANLIADGFSMSVGNFFSSKANVDAYDKHKATEYWEIENLRETEVEEIRDIYRKKGFEGELLEQVVGVITSNKDVWVDTMMKEELELSKDRKSPYQTAGMTFFSFLLIGFIPLAAYVFALLFNTSQDNLFLYACLLTGVALSIIGVLKSTLNDKNVLQGLAETLFLGGIAAILAYFAGDFLENLFR
ncbi:VIT1/CCC1 transporter family protein [Pontibacter flavimaris]|uniref:VIT1/CCC1 transporter family protein n=1 Tax=Pontibacter flavimaris TaxID=1797110 RepID=UPI000ABA912F|nr:VIT1/CCC1 transporter family protein [Pontibacter flavimaris]